MSSEKQRDKERLKKIVKSSLDRFKLNLSGLTIFTEAANGPYAYTPIVAALADAKKVYAFAKDSRFGLKEEIRENIMTIANEFGIADRISVVYEKDSKAIGECDIITNSGFLRPIDKKMIDAMKKTAVVSLMFEAWEYRKGDLDLDYCTEKEIPVLGTNEDKDGADVFSCLGFLISKVLFEIGVEIFKSKVLIIGGNKISKEIREFFNQNKISNTILTLTEGEHAPQQQIFHYQKFEDQLPLEEYDVVILSENINEIQLLGEHGVINKSNVSRLHTASFVHISGNVETEFIKVNSINVYPEKIASFGYMSVTGDYLGPLIPIELNTAGLKVGEIMASLRKEGYSYDEVIKIASMNPLISSFSDNITINKKMSTDEKVSSVSNPDLLGELQKLHFELRDFTKKKYNRINPFSEDLFSWEEKGAFWSGKNVVIYDSATISGDVKIGDQTWVGPFCDLDGGGKLTIGEYCCISAGTQILTHDTAKWSLSGGKAAYEYTPVEIGNYCFIGAGVIITRGIKIGNHCLIGAGSVVTKDIPDNSIAIGVPAKVVGKVVVENDTVRYVYN